MDYCSQTLGSMSLHSAADCVSVFSVTCLSCWEPGTLAHNYLVGQWWQQLLEKSVRAWTHNFHSSKAWNSLKMEWLCHKCQGGRFTKTTNSKNLCIYVSPSQLLWITKYNQANVQIFTIFLLSYSTYSNFIFYMTAPFFDSNLWFLIHLWYPTPSPLYHWSHILAPSVVPHVECHLK